MLTIRSLAAVIALSLALTTAAFAEPYTWSISASSTDPTQNVGDLPLNIPANLYLWLECTEQDGLSAMEATIETNDLFYLAFVPLNGVLNAGSGLDLLLAVGGCPSGPFLAGSITVLNFGKPSELCLVPSGNGLNASVDCSPTNPQLYDNAVRGFANPSITPCVVGTPSDCNPVSVEPSSWGDVKSLYR